MIKNETLLFKYVKKILSIVFLTNIPAILIVPVRLDQAIGWIAGTVGSGANFFLLYITVSRSMSQAGEEKGLKFYKGFYLRYLFLFIYAVLIVVILKPDILVFGLGLVSVQIVIYLYHLYEMYQQRKKDY